jgi:biopolymer transport protein ExbD
VTLQTQRRWLSDSSVQLDMTPLIDVVFILLLFFLVTTSFIKDSGLDLERPQAASASPLDTRAIRIGLTASGATYIDGQRVDGEQLRRRVAAAVSRAPQTPVVIVPDENSRSGRLVAVMDAAKLAGATNVAIATQPRRGSP